MTFTERFPGNHWPNDAIRVVNATFESCNKKKKQKTKIKEKNN